MIRVILYGIMLLVFNISCNTYHRQVASLSPDCQKLLRELKYRIITNDTGGYTFRFEHPTSDTIPKIETVRDLEYQNFTKTVLGNDSLCKCGFTYELITKTIGKESKKHTTVFNGTKCISTFFMLDFGYNCGGNKCPGATENLCNEIRFTYDLNGQLLDYFGVHYLLDIEPYYCTEYARKLITTQEYK